MLFYCTEPRKIPDIGLNCPSATWWAPAATSEEREIAFVAVTHAKRVLLLSVHEKTWNSLKKSREQFFTLLKPCRDRRHRMEIGPASHISVNVVFMEARQ